MKRGRRRSKWEMLTSGDDHRVALRPTLVLSAEVLKQIVDTIGQKPAESGGLLGGVRGEAITRFQYDETGSVSAATYTPDHVTLTRLLKSEWNPAEIRLRGFVHSHPRGMTQLSYGDEVYAQRILEANPECDGLWLPILNTLPDTGAFRFTPWAVVRSGKNVSVLEADVLVIKPVSPPCGLGGAVSYDVNQREILIDHRRERRPTAAVSVPFQREEAEIPQKHDAAFTRVQQAYDLDVMASSHVIAVGVGGAVSFIEDLARTGLGHFTLLDGDVVSVTNIGTQGVRRSDVGRTKVACAAERIKDINPGAEVRSIDKMLDDISDDEMAEIIRRRDVPSRTVVCAFTDSFFAQARVNRIALQFGIPALAAQLYREGRAGEIVFTHPDTTPACARCILSARYRHFLREKSENPVTSDGTPIWSTARVNALKGPILLALLHHGSSHPRWGSLLARIGTRNLVQVRMDPDVSETLGLKGFDKAFERADRDRLFFDEALWQAQTPESVATCEHACPDCGGTGKLRDAIGKFSDTRLLPVRAAS